MQSAQLGNCNGSIDKMSPNYHKFPTFLQTRQDKNTTLLMCQSH